ncbi:hypothetical protein ES705_27833 [subsurface metagenome]
MNLDKAIEINEHIHSELQRAATVEELNAIKLGIEALKTIKEMRLYPFPDQILQLPGETDD